jgi:hypothetical protein
MNDRTSVDEWLAMALAHTGMPLARRIETVEEWRSHLNQLIGDNRGAGMPDKQAVRAALEAFGQPEDLRRQLRHEQRMLDRRAAMAEVRKGIPLFMILTAVLVVPLRLVVETVSIQATVIGGLRFVVGMSAVSALVTYFAGLITMRIRRERPRAEFSFLARWGHWTVVSLVMATAAVWFPLLMIAAAYPIVADLPHFRLGLMSFWWAYGAAVLEDFGGIKTYLALVTLVVIALALTIYERSRCITFIMLSPQSLPECRCCPE